MEITHATAATRWQSERWRAPETGYNHACAPAEQERDNFQMRVNFSPDPEARPPGIQVTSAGAAAYALLSGTGPGTVLGITSRGWFLRVFNQRVVFLSRENYRGPLTVNVLGLPEAIPGIEPGTVVQIHEGWISFPGEGLELSIRQAKRWAAAPLLDQLPDHHEVTGRLTSVARQVFAARNPAGLSGLLPHLVALSGEGGDSLGVLAAVRQCQNALRNNQFSGVAASLHSLFGLGTGLTPSGDDLILGLLLTTNRCQTWITDRSDLERMNQDVIRTARARTTSLSASLIECAAMGQADERLVGALDGILTGNSPIDACAQDLLSWGSTSGVDALAGMAVAITGFDRR